MNILFLSLKNFTSLDESNIYVDLLKEFVSYGHELDIISPVQKREKTPTNSIIGESVRIYKPLIGNITNTGFLEKGISIFLYRSQIIKCIKKCIGNKKIDLFIVSVPPVTVDSIVNYVKKHYGCPVYLLLKDIWPASIFDVKVFGGTPLKKIVTTVLRMSEKRLYKSSDYIGCLSQANVDYICENNKYLDFRKVHVNPNSIIPHTIAPITITERNSIRDKYGIPNNKLTFIYGGTLGVGQNVYHIVDCMKECKDLDCHFVISGRGVQYHLLEQYKNNYKPKNLTLINGLPKDEYEKLLQSCDVGLVFLRYTAMTPNIPSRILTYMDYSLPILSCTDPTSDLNQIIENGNFGWGCLSNNPVEFKGCIEKILNTNLEPFKLSSNKFLKEHFSANESYSIIMKQLLPDKEIML